MGLILPVYNWFHDRFADIDPSKVPQHVALIPDGNRRWSDKHNLARYTGYQKAGTYENFKNLLTEAKEIGIPYFSVWGFSTENWNRPQEELNVFFRVVDKVLSQMLVDGQGYSFNHIGRTDRLPSGILEKMVALESNKPANSDYHFLFALDYGGRDEINHAFNRMIADRVSESDNATIRKYLYTGEDIPDPDLIIRAGGESRLSGFMPYQSAYTEFYTTNKLFPDFKPKDLRKAVRWYTRQDRRFGGDSAKLI